MRGKVHEHGFAMLALVMVIGIGSAGILVAVQAMVPPRARLTAQLQAGLSTIERAAREAFQRTGAYPANLDALARTSGLASNGPWRTDPWGDGRDFDYRVLPAGPRIASRGPDRRLRTADDVALAIDAEDLLRLRTNTRLRLIRATYLDHLVTAMTARSEGNASTHALQLDAEGAAPPVAAASLRAALRTYTLAKRQWRSAGASKRIALTAQMDAAARIIAAAQASAGWTTPPALTGAGGLMERLGLHDRLAVDGRGRPFVRHDTLAVSATGSDGRAASDDDF